MLSFSITKKAGLWGAAALACALALGSPAQATLVLNPGNPGGELANTIFNGCDGGTIGGPATTVKGCLNVSHATLVNFEGNENLVISGGQASIDAQDGFFTSVKISLGDGTLPFGTLVFQIDAVADGFADILAIDDSGTPFLFEDVALDGQGQNFFNLSSADGQLAVSLTITSLTTNNLADLKQVRVGGGDVPGVPEPTTLLLVGVGLIGLGTMGRRRRRAFPVTEL